MPSQYRRKLSPSFLVELTRLKSGNASERQRYENALVTMTRVMSDPVHPEFRKNLPDSYKAADVLQQYRLFFKIIPASKPGSPEVVYFVWINDEESIHRTGKPDDCYAVFADMVARGEVDPFVPEAEPTTEGFKRNEDWGAKYIYVSYWRKVQAAEQRADSHLILNRITTNNYLLQFITVSNQGSGLAQGLLKRLCQDADQHGVELTFELGTSEAHFPMSRHLLEKYGFEFDETVDDTEIWNRPPRK
jgi:hypothetical protein